MSNNQISLSLSDEFTIGDKTIVYKDIIIDRKSKYTVVWTSIKSKEDADKFMKNLVTDDYYRKATHNTYAFRVKLENWSILEWKNDDWETWAGMCILRELQRENAIDLLLVVTRYFWGIKLQSDRYKHVINSCKIFFEKIKN
jgi:putative IMPACT (imprinted ancient) family translation regulator